MPTALEVGTPATAPDVVAVAAAGIENPPMLTAAAGAPCSTVAAAGTPDAAAEAGMLTGCASIGRGRTPVAATGAAAGLRRTDHST